MKTPFSVKVIKLCAWFALLASLLTIALIIYAIDGPELQNDFARGLRAGTMAFLARLSGSAPDRVSRFDAYDIVGEFLPAIVLLVLVLHSISKRRILYFRIVATIALLAGLGSISAGRMVVNGVLFVIIGALAWTPPVTRYLKSGKVALDHRSPAV
jgi:hypothetical protein